MKYIVRIAPSLNEEAYAAFNSKYPGVGAESIEFSIEDFREAPAEGELVSYLWENLPICVRGTIHRVSREYKVQAPGTGICNFTCELDVYAIFDEESCVWMRA